MEHGLQVKDGLIAQLHTLLLEHSIPIPNHLLLKAAKSSVSSVLADVENIPPTQSWERVQSGVNSYQLHLAEQRLDREAEVLFETLDANGDGLIERHEWERAKSTWERAISLPGGEHGMIAANLPGYRGITDDTEAASKPSRSWNQHSSRGQLAPAAWGEVCSFHQAIEPDLEEVPAVGVGSNSSILGPTRVSDVSICRQCKLLHVVCACKDPIAEARKRRAQ